MTVTLNAKSMTVIDDGSFATVMITDNSEASSEPPRKKAPG